MTIHETIIIRTVVRWLALLIFTGMGWKTEGNKPNLSRYVIIAAPHTSNWDFIYTLCLTFIYRINPVIMMKDAWFRWPLGPFFRWLGALPIDRSRANNVVAQSIAKFQTARPSDSRGAALGNPQARALLEDGILSNCQRCRRAHCARFFGLPAQSRRIRPHRHPHRQYRRRHGRDPQFLPGYLGQISSAGEPAVHRPRCIAAGRRLRRMTGGAHKRIAKTG